MLEVQYMLLEMRVPGCLAYVESVISSSPLWERNQAKACVSLLLPGRGSCSMSLAVAEQRYPTWSLICFTIGMMKGLARARETERDGSTSGVCRLLCTQE